MRVELCKGTAVVSCSSVLSWLGGVDRCIFVKDKLRRAWVGAWVHGMVGLHWGCCFIMLGSCFYAFMNLNGCDGMECIINPSLHGLHGFRRAMKLSKRFLQPDFSGKCYLGLKSWETLTKTIERN